MKRSKSSKEKPKKHIKEVKQTSNLNKSMLIALIVSLLSLILTAAISVPGKEILNSTDINNSSVYLLIIVLSVILFWGTFKQNFRLISIPLLFLIIFSVGISLIPLSYYQISEYGILIKLKIYQSILIFSTIAFGIIALWLKKDKLHENIDKLFQSDPKRFSFKSLFKKSEILYTLFFVAVIGLSIYTNFNKLDNFDLYSDEAQVTQGAYGYMYSGEYHQYNFATNELNTDKYYNRAKPHQFVLAKSYEIFGVSTWTSRLPSALFGVLLVILAYFISRFFIKDKFAALIIIFSFACSYEFLLLQRWARMYAMLMPVFLLAFFYAYRFMTQKNSFSFLKLDKYRITDNYLNYNYLMLPFFLVFFWLAFELHMNSVILMLILFFFSLIAIPLIKEKRYVFISIIGAVILLSQLIFPFNLGYRWLTFFESDNLEFYKFAFLGFPFTFNTNIIFVALVTIAAIFSKNKQFTKNYLVLISVFIIGLILFAYIIDFSQSFRYMSFLASLTVMLSIAAGLFIVKTVFNRFAYYCLSFLMLVSVLMSFQSKYDDLYVKNTVSPANPSKAWKVITENYNNNELLMMHWGPTLYLNDLDSGAHVQSLYKYRKENFNTILDTLDNYKSGWITWHTHNSRLIDADLIDYANIYFIKHHGFGIDETGVEVFSYNESMQRPLDVFNIEKNIPAANLKTDKTYSIAFTLELKEFSRGKPFFIKTADNKEIITFNTEQDHNLIIKYINENDSLKMQLPLDKQSHIVWYQKAENDEMTYGLFLNGKLFQSKLLSTVSSELVKFKVNPKYNGLINDIRIYDIVLNDRQIKQVMKYIGRPGSEELEVDDESFRTLYYWQRQ